MKRLWYYFVKGYTRLVFFFYFKRLIVDGKENIPRDKPVLFVANHQNALIDPLLIGVSSPRVLHFLTRADVFVKPFYRFLMGTVNMMPIYRIRDGRSSLSRNEAIFKKCYHLLGNNSSILIFPEGNHNIERRLRPLSKGFTRIAFGALETQSGMDLHIVPIGLNYSRAEKFGSSVRLVFGQAIAVQPFFTERDAEGGMKLKTRVFEGMKALICHLPSDLNNAMVHKKIEEEAFLHPETLEKKLLELDALPNLNRSPNRMASVLRLLVAINTWLGVLLWRKFHPKIDEKEFIATYRFSLGATLIPLQYLLQAILLASFLGKTWGWCYFLGSLLLVRLYITLQKD